MAEGKTQNPDARPGTKRHKKKVPPKKKTKTKKNTPKATVKKEV